MNKIKLYKELLDMYDKGKQLYFEEVENLLYISDSYRVWALDKRDCLLNIENLQFKKVDLTHFMEVKDGYVDGYKLSEMKEIDGKIGVYIQSNSDDSIKALINKKFLNVFEKNCEFRIKDDKSPIYIYENDNLVGLILPMRIY